MSRFLSSTSRDYSKRWDVRTVLVYVVPCTQLHTAREHRLTKDEKQRNGFGTSTKFTYNSGEPTEYPSSLPGFFPALYRCQCTMEPFDLPTLNGLHLIPGLCDGVFLGAGALAGFPSLQTLPHTAMLGHHGVNVHGSESRNKSMIVHIQNRHENKKSQDVAAEMIGQRIFVGWPFLQEGMVSAVSDSLFKYEKMSVIPGKPPKVIQNPHTPQGLGMWKSKAERIDHFYSKRCGVITGDIEVLLHVRPLKGKPQSWITVNSLNLNSLNFRIGATRHRCFR